MSDQPVDDEVEFDEEPDVPEGEEHTPEEGELPDGWRADDEVEDDDVVTELDPDDNPPQTDDKEE